MVNKTLEKLNTRIRINKNKLIFLVLLSVALFTYLKPQQMINLWLTPDQQGQILFNAGHYQQAGEYFTKVKWQAFSYYGAEQYKNSAMLYSQFDDIDSKIAQANALAHRRDYLKARDLYQTVLITQPNNIAANTNIKIVQAIIDETNLLSASQQEEQGEDNKELGDDEPQAADGAERQVAREQEIEQLSSEQLLLDPELNKMWLRQVQKDPAQFLAQKFYMQLENAKQIKEKPNEK